MHEWVFVTQSDAKLREAERILQVTLERRSLDLPEIQAIEVRTVVAEKARYAYEQLGRPVMVEDTGLAFKAWMGLPGALVRWFVDRVGVEGISRMMESFPERGAVAETVVATYDGQLHTYVGVQPGRIVDRPRGAEGFGWDALFVPDGAHHTFAEMAPEEKDRYSMRRMALERMLESFT